MNVGPSFVANDKATEAGDTAPDTAVRAGGAVAPAIISLVGMELCRPMFRAATFTPDGGERIEQGLEHPAVMDVGARELGGQRNTLSVGDDVAL